MGKRILKNLELDAELMLAGMRGQEVDLLLFERKHKSKFASMDEIVERAKWLEGQKKSYVSKVAERAQELKVIQDARYKVSLQESKVPLGKETLPER